MLARNTAVLISVLTAMDLYTGSCYEHHVKGPSFLVEPPGKVEFSNTSGIWVDCTATGIPPPTTEWISADGGIVDDVQSVRRVLRNGTLVILPFDAAAYRQDVHNAVYRCVASNSVGRIISRDVQIRAVVAQAYKISAEVLSASKGCTAVLRCVIPSFVKDFVKVVSWVQDSAIFFFPKLQGDGKYHVLPTGELLVHDLQPEDQYPQYKCRTMHRLTRQVVGSPPTSIRMSGSRGTVAPAIIEHTGTVQVTQDEGAVLLCLAQGCPDPIYRWYSVSGSEGDLFIPGPRIHVLGPVLALETVTAEDSGSYRCSASNAGGEASAEVRLAVSTPLRVDVSPSSVSVHAGGSAEFSCNIHSQGQHAGKLAVTWYKDGRPLPAFGRYNSYSLLVKGITKEDRGMYQCMVRRPEGETAQAAGELQLGDAPPTLLYSFIEQTLQPGPPVSLKCSAAGNPTPQISWALDGFPLPDSSRFVIGQYMTVHGDVISHVNISQVAVEDGGEYTCTAENRAGKVSHSARLNVYGLPYIRLIPKVTAIAGETMRLKCPVAGYPIEEIHWEQGGKELPTEMRQNVERDGTLAIASVQKESDAGLYTCWARNKQGKSARRNAEVAVIVPPKLSSSPDRTLNIGERASLTCSVIKGDLPMSMAWFKDGKTVNARSVTITQLDQFNSILLIEGLSEEHTGNYSCVAKNAAAEVSHATFLSVNVPPIIEPFSFQDGLSEGMRTRTVCGVSQGDSPLTITWLKDGGDLPPHLGANYTTLDAYSSLLSIPSLTSSHSGDYTCVASNPAAVLRYTAKLLVKVPPKWTIEPNTVANVERNRNIMIHCQADGVPKPRIVWKKATGGKSGDYEEVRERLHTKVFQNGSLLLQNVKEDREGIYMCQASNGIGNAIGRMIQVKVNSPPHFTAPSRQVTVKKGDTATLVCHVNGDKPITVSWVRNGNVELTPQTSYRVSVKQELTPNGIVAELNVMDADAADSGIYFCRASNLYGKEQQMIQLQVQEPPENPSGLEVVSTSSRTVKLQWNQPTSSAGEKIKYLVQYAEGEGPHWQTVEAGESPSLTISDLKPATKYSVRILAEGLAGRSAPSAPLAVKTAPQRPGGPPLHINVKPVSSTEILLTWSPPVAELRYGDILGYNIGYRESSSGSSSYVFTNVYGDGEEGGELLLTGLSKYTRYSIVIQAFNQVGPGPLSEQVLTQTLEDVPSMAPEEVKCSALSPQSLQISWQPPAASHSNGIIQGYKIHVEPLHDDLPQEVEDGEPKKTSGLTLIVPGLRKFTNYSVQVLAFTRVGDGVLTKPIYCCTEEDVPGPPADIKVVVKSSQSLLVSWLPPADPNGIIVKYNLYMRTMDAASADLTQGKRYLPVQHTRYEATNLRQSVEYRFRVTASTRVGEGESSRVVVQIPSIRVPARISSFGGPVYFPWQTSATLPCLAVGQPEPRREWLKNDEPMKSGIDSNYRILPDGELLMSNLRKSDTANYTCLVENSQGSDRIHHSVVVQVPPSAPVLYVTSATSSSILLHWKAGSSGGAVISGYILNYRKLQSGPEELLLPRRITSYELKNLSCGSTYHLFLVAQNKIGRSTPSSPLTVRTQGEAPGAPQGTTLIQPNSTSVLLRLHVWPDNGCPLLFFVIQYKATTENNWMTVSNSMKPQKKFTIPGLRPASVYQLKIEAHNIAGSSMAEFTFITLTKDGDPPPPELITGSHSSQTFIIDVRIMISLLVAIAAMLSLLTAMVFCWRNKQSRPLKEQLEKQQDADAQRERYYATVHKVAMHANGDKIPETSEDISPYATFQLSETTAPTNILLHSLMYHEQALTDACASPPPSGMKMNGGRKRSRSRKREAPSEDSDSDAERPTSSRLESSDQLASSRKKSIYMYHGPHSSTSSDISAVSEAKSLPRRSCNRTVRNNNRWLVSGKATLRSLLPLQPSAETNFAGPLAGRATPERREQSEAERDADTLKNVKAFARSRHGGHSNRGDYSIAV